MGAFIVATLISIILIPVLLVGGMLWESFWAAMIWQQFMEPQGWPAIGGLEWLAINGIVTIFCRQPHPKKTHKWSWALGVVGPPLCYLVASIAWWLLR